jgi:hypothetical protein
MVVRLESPLNLMERLSLRHLFNIDKVTAPPAKLSTLPKAWDDPFCRGLPADTQVELVESVGL